MLGSSRMIRAGGIALGLLLLLATACSVRTLTRQLTLPADLLGIDTTSPYLKAHMKDGRVYVLSPWTLGPGGRTVQGQGQLLSANREDLGSGEWSVPIDSVAIFETNQLGMPGGIAALSVVSIASAAFSVYCLSNPKACFGSCPTFYAWDGQQLSLQAEGFSASVAPSLEATDIDALYHLQPMGPEVSLFMTNEALETHVVRSVRLLSAPRSRQGRVLVTPGGEFREARRFQAPATCVGLEGDCLAQVLALDGEERFSLADSLDLGRRETLELSFPGGLGESVGLVIAARQSLLSTYLFYQTLAYMGEDVGCWLAALERGGEAMQARQRGIADALGGIEVAVRERGGRWRTLADVRETGPLATDLRVVPLPAVAGEPLRLRLRLTQGLWRLDYLALAELGAAVEPLAIAPSAVRCNGRADPAALAQLLDPEAALITSPGDRYELCFTLPGDHRRQELFLESRGYYLEWMREEWLAERDPELAMAVFRNPRRMLRRLAPDFKAVEAGMETAFWGSRYASP
jgi:hypothetical protein